MGCRKRKAPSSIRKCAAAVEVLPPTQALIGLADQYFNHSFGLILRYLGDLPKFLGQISQQNPAALKDVETLHRQGYYRRRGGKSSQLDKRFEQHKLETT